LGDVLEEAAKQHAMSKVDGLYGAEAPMGELGQGHTLRSALRHVHQEWETAHQKRALGEQIGVKLNDHEFHQDLNSRMSRAVCHAITGLPAEHTHSFGPYSHKVPLETAQALVYAAAKKKGIRNPYELMKKSESPADLARAMLGRLRLL
jgi:hypothetical protein